jgi:hypothetical protein
LFHIYPTDGKVNGERSNFPYGEVAIASITTQNGSKLGSSATLDYSGTVFEPIDEYKGDLARGYFYMCTRYMGEDAGWSAAAGQMTSKAEILPWGLALLLSWHHADSVSTKEINRNNSIYQIQHNRNPFIDNPQWADSIWAQLVTTYKFNFENNLRFSIQPNPAKDNIKINVRETKNLNLKMRITNFCGQILLEQSLLNSSQDIDITSLSKGIYIIELQNNTNHFFQKLVVE